LGFDKKISDILLKLKERNHGSSNWNTALVSATLSSEVLFTLFKNGLLLFPSLRSIGWLQ
jgi:hypothetical protein